MSDAIPAPAGMPRRLFIHCIGSPVPGHDRFAERALVLARGDDMVCVPRGIEPEYLGFLSALGLGPAAANVIVTPAAPGETERSLTARLLHAGGKVEMVARRLGPVPVTVHPYAGTTELFALARALERVSCRSVRVHAPPPEVQALVHQRALMRARAAELGIPVPEGEVAELASPLGRRRHDLEPLRLAIARRYRRAGRVLVRGALGMNGSSSFVVGEGGDDVDEVLRRIALASDNRAYLVEEMMEATVRSTVHLRVEAGDVGFLGLTDRRPGRGAAPAGSRTPCAARTVEAMRAWAELLGGWLRDAGYAGPLGLEFVEYRDPDTGQPRSVFTGVESRASEATYALAIRDALGACGYVSGTLTTRVPGFGRLREALGGLLYDPDRGSGVMPYATGCLDQGRCPIVALGTDRLHSSELLGKAQAAVATAWGRH